MFMKNNFVVVLSNTKHPNEAGMSRIRGLAVRTDAEGARAKGCVVYIPARGADTAPAVPTRAGDFRTAATATSDAASAVPVSGSKVE